MSKLLNPDRLKIGYVILVATRKFAVEKLQRKASYGDSSKWTHVAGSLGGCDVVATMNNLPYDTLQFFWFPLLLFCGKINIVLRNLFSSRKRFFCSELITTGFYKEGDYLFGKIAEIISPADFDNLELFEEVKDIWL